MRTVRTATASVRTILAVETVVLRAEESVDAVRRKLVAMQHSAESEDNVEAAVKQALRKGIGMRLLCRICAGEGGCIERGCVLRRSVSKGAPAIAGFTGGIVRHAGIMPCANRFGKAEASLQSPDPFARMPAWVPIFLNSA